MIGFLHGTIQSSLTTQVVLMTSGGVGYLVTPTGSLLTKCQTGQEISMFVYTVVREQEISLYGFEDLPQKQLFEKVLTVSGVGPKIAIQIASYLPDDFLNAVESEDIAFITKIPGVGKKMAQKIILELKGKLTFIETDSNGLSIGSSPDISDAIEGLKMLGYNESSISDSFSKMDTTGKTSEELIRSFLGSH